MRRRKKERKRERDGERRGVRMKWDHKEKERPKSDRYLGYCLTRQYCWKEGGVLNMTVTGHNKDT